MTILSESDILAAATNEMGQEIMAIGERIRFFRIMRGMTQKHLGMLLGFPEKSADVRLAQYETGTRSPKADITDSLASALDVSTQALAVPDIDSLIGLAHTLFALEDIYGLKVHGETGNVCLQVEPNDPHSEELLAILESWQEQATKLEAGEITQEEYNRWRYCYPKFDTTQQWAKVPSQMLSSALVEAFKNRLDE